jgi:hypothetical protein
MNLKEKMASRRMGSGFGDFFRGSLPVDLSQLPQPPRAGLSRLWPNSLALTAQARRRSAAVAWSMLALKVGVRITRIIRQMPYLGHDRGSLAEILCLRSE